jgi:hypothetical protein
MVEIDSNMPLFGITVDKFASKETNGCLGSGQFLPRETECESRRASASSRHCQPSDSFRDEGKSSWPG